VGIAHLVVLHVRVPGLDAPISWKLTLNRRLITSNMPGTTRVSGKYGFTYSELML
jgi:hypothetical protein